MLTPQKFNIDGHIVKVPPFRIFGIQPLVLGGKKHIFRVNEKAERESSLIFKVSSW